ncbi:hypothetical protein [Novosphingobium sp. HII-3]|uniref:hypothetical protein n=1 Tax=Novosphingobium sp. HII-3 TaxID=2075565 RepID=UPI000CDA4D97|nr:hypothetical protein [Novosphingobium sp. HII-3]
MIFLRFPSHFPVRATEWMLAGMKTTMGIGFLSPIPFFDNPAMRGLAAIGSQESWGIVAFVAGVVHLTMLYINGTWRRSPHWRGACSLFGMMFWVQILIGFAGSPVATSAWLMYPWLIIFSARNVWVAWTDARLSDEKAKVEYGGGR